MSSFPPATTPKSVPQKVVDTSTVTTGKGGIKAGLKIKNAGTKNAPGFDKTVNTF